MVPLWVPERCCCLTFPPVFDLNCGVEGRRSWTVPWTSQETEWVGVQKVLVSPELNLLREPDHVTEVRLLTSGRVLPTTVARAGISCS